MSRQLLIRIAPFWILLVLIGSFMPGAKHALGTSSSILTHRLYHVASFGSAALILLLIADNGPRRLAALLGVVTLGVLIEFLQHSIYSIPVEWWDIRDDSVSAAGAWLVTAFPAVRNKILRTP